MKEPPRASETEALIRAIERYLALVKAMRELGPARDRPGGPAEK